MDVTALQERMAENVRVLLAVTGIRSQAELARRAGWEAAKVSRLLKGTQEWTLSDIVAVGEIFGLADPFMIGRPLSEVVGAVDPAAVGGGVSRNVSARYHGTNRASIIPFPQARVAARRYLTSRTHSVTASGTAHSGHTTPLIDHVADIMSPVTTAVGL